MFVRLFSDLHLECGNINVPVIENEKDIVVVLAGDIGVADRPRTIGPFVHEMAQRHRAVVYVAGNHEHWDSSFLRTYDKIRSAIGMWQSHDQSVPNAIGIPSNVHTLQNEVVEIDDVVFIGATLWTSYRNHNDLAMFDAKRFMKDYKKIRTGSEADPYRRKFEPMDAWFDHNHSKEFIFKKIKEYKDLGKKVFVVTHHAPSELSIAPEYRTAHDDLLNASYATELGNDIADLQPNIWVHGHTHTSHDYTIGDTRIVCNPRGYFIEHLVPTFNPNFLIEV